jgi:hypothetical protein
LVPDIALLEAGHIRTASADSGAQAKHAFYALTQTATMLFQDDDLKVVETEGSIVLKKGPGEDTVESGLVVMRLPSGGILVVSNSPESLRKLLETAHRYCARWIRLDI